MAVFKNQELKVILTAKSESDTIINLTGKTIHFLTRDPRGNVDTDTSPTISTPTNGQVEHSYAINDLNRKGGWEAKLFGDTTDMPSTKYNFHVFEIWER